MSGRLATHMMQDATMALLFFPLVYSHRLNRSLITATKNLLSISSCIVPQTLPMAQHSVFKEAQEKSWVALCTLFNYPNKSTTDIKRKSQHNTTPHNNEHEQLLHQYVSEPWSPRTHILYSIEEKDIFIYITTNFCVPCYYG